MPIASTRAPWMAETRPTWPWRRWPVYVALIDSSVLGAWFMDDEPAHGAAVLLMDQVGAGEIEPVLAEHCHFEIRHALVRAARRGAGGHDSGHERVEGDSPNGVVAWVAAFPGVRRPAPS